MGDAVLYDFNPLIEGGLSSFSHDSIPPVPEAFSFSCPLYFKTHCLIIFWEPYQKGSPREKSLKIKVKNMKILYNIDYLCFLCYNQIKLILKLVREEISMSNVQIYVIHHDGENYPTFESENIIPILAGNPVRTDTVSHFGIPPEVHALLIRKARHLQRVYGLLLHLEEYDAERQKGLCRRNALPLVFKFIRSAAQNISFFGVQIWI